MQTDLPHGLAYDRKQTLRLENAYIRKNIANDFGWIIETSRKKEIGALNDLVR